MLRKRWNRLELRKLSTIEEIRSDVLVLEKDTVGVLDEIVGERVI
jgi:hypothetical protein